MGQAGSGRPGTRPGRFTQNEPEGSRRQPRSSRVQTPPSSTFTGNRTTGS